MNTTLHLLILLATAFPQDRAPSPIPPVTAAEVAAAVDGVVDLPAGSNPTLLDLFSRYTWLTAPNGGAIHLVATDGVSDAQLIRAREIMRFYLTDAPGTRYGSDKSGVANSMADHGATLVMFATERDAFGAYRRLGRIEGLFFQDLYATETIVEGSPEYLTNRGRDAALEEVFHLVQGAGIRYALPDYQLQLEQAAANAARNDLWQANPEWWLEGSNSFEYAISVIDVLYGLWAHDPDRSGESFGGEYRFCQREEIESGDPTGVRAIQDFLPGSFSADLRIDSSFEGTFSLTADDDAYTLKSRWLKSVRLTGTRDSNLQGNSLNNVLAGNSGNNRIDGGEGHDIAVFSGLADEYDIEIGDHTVTVTGPDGKDVLSNIQCLQFADGTRPPSGSCQPVVTSMTAATEDGGSAWMEIDEDPVQFASNEFFAIFDRNDDGQVSAQEIPNFMRSFREVVREADTNDDQSLDRVELGKFVDGVLSEEWDDEEREYEDWDDEDGEDEDPTNEDRDNRRRGDRRHLELPDVDTSRDPNGVVPVGAQFPPEVSRVFRSYTCVRAPSGRPIHILADEAWSEDRVVRARKVLEHLLTDAPGTQYGADKTAILESMADQQACLVLLRDMEALERAFDGVLGEFDLAVQDLRANECPVEGSEDYLAHETRDAAYEEIFHFIHDYGIRPVIPEYDEAIEVANRALESRDLWEPWSEYENHRNEYIAAVLDNYYDLWTVTPTLYEGETIAPDDVPSGTSHFGVYGAGSRERLATLDPDGLALIQSFVHPHITYLAELPVDFEGTFVMRCDPKLRYTAKSQHLTRVSLRGSNPSGVIGNDRDNELVGNDGDNTLEGATGDDRIVGGEGLDTAIYSGLAKEYQIYSDGDLTTIRDQVKDRDGTDTLVGVERLRFTDREVSLR